MARFVDIGGCPVPTGNDFHLAVRYAINRTGVTPTTVYRGDEPEALRILHTHGKHSQRELYDAAVAGRGAQFGILGIPNRPGTSTHELRAAGIFSVSLTSRIPDYKCGMDWPPAKVDAVIRALNELGCDAFRPYPDSRNERQHVCCRKPPRFTVGQRLALDPLQQGDRSELVRSVQILLHRGGFYRGRVATEIGTFGPALAKAVKRFQSHVGLKPDAVVGPKTFAAMRRRWGL